MVSTRVALAIPEHRLAPGTKLVEDEVGAIYGVSRTVVRAALQKLAHDRLVTLQRNKGAGVSQPSIRVAREVFEARSLPEPRTARSAAERITPEALVRLQSHIDQEHVALAAGDPGHALRLSGLFHIEIARIADAPVTAALDLAACGFHRPAFLGAWLRAWLGAWLAGTARGAVSWWRWTAW